MNAVCTRVERTALEFAQPFDIILCMLYLLYVSLFLFIKYYFIQYIGIDVSIAPSCAATGLPGSIATAYEHLGLGGFGNVGTLTVSALVTDVIKRLDVMVSKS